MGKRISLVGHVYGLLTVLSRAEKEPGCTYARWLCACECGKKKLVLHVNLRNGHSTSCGCIRVGVQTGISNTPGYINWQNMNHRCSNTTNPHYYKYGGAGIFVHPAWACDFAAFISYVGPKPSPVHTIERKDNTLGYVPGNVCWATRKEQQANRSNTLFVDYKGEQKALCSLPRHESLSAAHVRGRVFNCGWSVERALTTPVT